MSSNRCRCTSTSIEPCDYCSRELCESCADDQHECDGDACDCDCDKYEPDLGRDDRDIDNSQATQEYENWLEKLKDRGGR